MKFLLLVFCFISFISCGRSTGFVDYLVPDKTENIPFSCKPSEVNDFLYRCENKEVICYFSTVVGGGVFCTFKKEG